MTFIHLDSRCLFTVLICTSFCYVLSSNPEIKVNPPQDFEIVDPGYLGYLCLQWKPPLFLDNFKECTVEYELKYRNFGSKIWKTIITTNLYYKDGFDLNKGVEAKIHTLLPQQCTNESTVRSLWSEATYWTPPQGNVETKIQDMDCVYYNWLYLFCSWKPGMDVPLDTNYNLFYWYDGLDHPMQCDDYMTINGQNTGCSFPSLKSPDYKDFYICVNGSSRSTAIRPSYFIFQLQNIVKPLPPDYVSLTLKDSNEVILKWSVPAGPIPAACFIYEVLVTEDDTTRVSTTIENEMCITRKSNKSNQVCFLVKSKVNIYCSETGIWSEWSEEQCWRGDIWKETLIYFMVPFGFVSLLGLLITLLILFKQRAVLNTVFDSNKEDFTQQEALC
ncbi:interleukin-13 receptor subunit alpha-2 [Elephas maximus indicus]|uniref:interleukin-13 receptor subunit alpha-2 n=1 Tax=Elephas maximus indicus TaxID=99487 RepID=UPI000223521A|nr:interleukin-13 receptor subunit alpha-2 [Loxodonta africana]XP_049728332.1 interleukin-13 receptor subunit alpha-2 [Elephas maximus indicus]